MKKHFKKHNGFCACNRSKKNNLTEVWHEVNCELCKKNGEYLMAKMDKLKEKLESKQELSEPKKELSACGKTYDEFMEAVNDDCSNVEFKSWLVSEWVNTPLFDKYDLKDDIVSVNNGLKNYRIKPTPPKEIVIDGNNFYNGTYKLYEDSNHTELNGLSDKICGVDIDDIIKVAVTNLCDNMQNYDVYKFGCELKTRLKGGE